MQTQVHPALGKLGLFRAACLLLTLCAGTAIASPAQTFTTLYSFCSRQNCADGADPLAGLVQANDGNLYGTTSAWGANNYGTLFEITPSGVLTTLYTFCSQQNCADGATPRGRLVRAADGNLYGTTAYGGNGGTVFRVAATGVLTTIYSFCSQLNCPDGSYPQAGLAQGTDGNFYGTTRSGGAHGNNGTVFKITPSGTLTTLHSFNGVDGENPVAALVQGTDGNFYGTTQLGGANSWGTVFKITPSGALTTLHSFCSQQNCADGTYPTAGLVQGTDGNLYGTTDMGGTGTYCGSSGSNDCGTVFKISPGGGLTTLYNFCSQPNCADGVGVGDGLIQATDGNFYGVTGAGGGDGCAFGGGCGTIFEITPAGTLTTLHSFTENEGTSPAAELLQAANGNFYGTTYYGGANGLGTVFSLSGPAPTPVQFVPVTPCRLVDTRIEQGGGTIQGGTFDTFGLPQLAQTYCPGLDLSQAAAYSLNVTVVPHGMLGYLTIWPAGRSQPNVSTMNSYDGRVKANAAIVPAGASAAVSVYVTDTTDVILDIDGYFTAPGTGTLQFYPLTPCRVADTRDSGYPQGLGPPRLAAQQPREFPMLTSPCLQNLPQQPVAYSLNVTVVPNPWGQPLGYLTVWPSNQQQPDVSTLNNPTATVVANAAIVPAAANGDISAFAYNSSTDLIIDVNGYFAAPGGQNALSLYPVAPCRVFDTRTVGNGQPFQGTWPGGINVTTSSCAPPASAQAFVLNATVVPSGLLGYLTLWPDGGLQPLVSTLNAYDGAVTSNLAIVPSNVSGYQGSINAYADGLTQLILDISGYFAP